MVTARGSRAARWFGRVVWLGIGVNLALAIPTLIVPDRILMFAGLPPSVPLLWPRFAAWLLILLSAFYVPGAIDPYRHRLVAWMSVLARLAGVLFFATQPPAYYLLGGIDLTFFIPAAILLAAASKYKGLDGSPWREPSAAS
jgi:hypothetical protein